MVKEEIKNTVEEHLNIDEFDEDYSTNEIFNSEMNYNNADKTTGQYCHTKEEIKEMVKEAFRQICEGSDHCSECGRPHNEEGDIIDRNPVPYGDTYVDENVVVGHVCVYCGERE